MPNRLTGDVHLAYQRCNDGEIVLGSKCIKIITEQYTWKLANDKCRSMQSKLIHLHDIIQEKKLAYLIATTKESLPSSFWISGDKEEYNGEWRRISLRMLTLAAPFQCVRGGLGDLRALPANVYSAPQTAGPNDPVAKRKRSSVNGTPFDNHCPYPYVVATFNPSRNSQRNRSALHHQRSDTTLRKPCSNRP